MKSKLWHSASLRKVAAAASLVLLGLSGAAQAQAQSVFQAVRVDMSEMRGGPAQTIQQLQTCLSRELPRAFAGRIVPGDRSAPVLVVRPQSVFLASAAGGSVGTFDREIGMSIDTMEGVGIVSGRRIPLTVSASPGNGAFSQLGFTTNPRVETLCQSFALWMARRT
jgi:hypothetical protein